jgi:hypothetical protein
MSDDMLNRIRKILWLLLILDLIAIAAWVYECLWL